MKKFLSISLALFFLMSLGVVNAQEAKASESTAIAATEEASVATAAEMAAMSNEDLKAYLKSCTAEEFAQAIATAVNSGNRNLARRVLLIANQIMAEANNEDLLLAVDKVHIGISFLGGALASLDSDGSHINNPTIPQEPEDDPVPPPPPPISGRSAR